MKLRAYQRKAAGAIRRLLSNGERPLCYAPTGAGKTVIAGAVFAQVSKGLRVFVVHTDQLRTQAQEALQHYGVTVVTIQGLLLRPDVFRKAVLVCFDECHHLRGQAWREAVELFGKASIFGLSATPYASELDEIFTCRVTAARVQELIKDGHVLPVSIVRPSDAFLEGLEATDRIDGAKAYLAKFANKQAVHFEPTVELCKRAATQYEAAGVPHAVVHGKTARATRDAEIERFRQKRLRVLISPVLLSEGFDAPCAEVLIAGRAFASEVLLQQGVGRIRRAAPGKKRGYVVDCTGCCADKTASYFNATDETSFSALPEAKVSKRDGEKREPKEPQAFTWVACDDWVLERAEAPAELKAAIVEAKAAAEAIEAAVKQRAALHTATWRAKPDSAAKVKAWREKNADRLLAQARERAKAKSADPSHRAKLAEKKRLKYKDPEWREKKLRKDKERLQNPEYKARRAAQAAAYRQRPDVKARRAEQLRAWILANPERYAASQKKAQAKYKAKKTAA